MGWRSARHGHKEAGAMRFPPFNFTGDLSLRRSCPTLSNRCQPPLPGFLRLSYMKSEGRKRSRCGRLRVSPLREAFPHHPDVIFLVNLRKKMEKFLSRVSRTSKATSGGERPCVLRPSPALEPPLRPPFEAALGSGTSAATVSEGHGTLVPPGADGAAPSTLWPSAVEVRQLRAWHPVRASDSTSRLRFGRDAALKRRGA